MARIIKTEWSNNGPSDPVKRRYRVLPNCQCAGERRIITQRGGWLDRRRENCWFTTEDPAAHDHR